MSSAPTAATASPDGTTRAADLSGIDSILVINVSRIGDTLLVTPVVRALAAAWPDARITFLGHPKRVEIVRHLPFIHRVGGITKSLARLRGRFGGRTHDLALVFGYDAELVEYALRVARRVVAFRQPDDALNARLFRATDPPAHQTRHAVLYALTMLAPIGIPPAGLHLSYRVSAQESAWAAGALRDAGVGDARPLIGLQVASFPTKAYRDWPIERFIELCQRIRTEHARAHFLIFGGKLERERTWRLHAELTGCSTDFSGRLSLRETAALMDTLDLYIGVDTGPTHIMGALHRPMVAMYHGYSPSRLLGPLEHPCAYVVDHPRAETGCTPEDSMAEISVDAVWEAVRRAFAEHPPRVQAGRG